MSKWFSDLYPVVSKALTSRGRYWSGLLIAMVGSVPAMADVSVHFVEGTPWDLIRIVNESPCAREGGRLTIDLMPQRLGLVLNSTQVGIDLHEVAKVDLLKNGSAVERIWPMPEGSGHLVLSLRDLQPNEEVIICVDIAKAGLAEGEQSDLGPSGIEGAMLFFDNRRASFDKGGRAVIAAESCR